MLQRALRCLLAVAAMSLLDGSTQNTAGPTQMRFVVVEPAFAPMPFLAGGAVASGGTRRRLSAPARAAKRTLNAHTSLLRCTNVPCAVSVLPRGLPCPPCCAGPLLLLGGSLPTRSSRGWVACGMAAGAGVEGAEDGDERLDDTKGGMQKKAWMPPELLQPEAAWTDMRDMGKIRDECKALLADSRQLVLKDLQLAKTKWETALDTVEETGEEVRIVTAYNLVLNLCAYAATRGQPRALDTALDVMSRMVERGATPTLVSFNTLMNVCAKSAAADLGEQAVTNARTVLSMMEDANIRPDAITFTSMLDVCARAAAVRGGRGGWTRGWQNGQDVLDLMRTKGVRRTAMTYNVMISICITGASARLEGQSYILQEAVDRGVSVLATMRQDGVRPDSDTYNHLFTVCAKAAGGGYKDAAVVAQQIFSELRHEGLASEMGVETWNALANTFAKCANLSLAEQLVLVEMPAAGVCVCVCVCVCT